MKIVVTGGTGSIGEAVTRCLVHRGHEVQALSRSTIADERLRRWGASPLRGDLRAPSAWAATASRTDAIILMGETSTEDMGVVDDGVVDALFARRPQRVIYTGVCWLYGETGDRIARENDGLNAPPSFAFAQRNGERLLASDIKAAVIHPAMVYQADGGVFERFLTSARAGEPVEIWADPATRWPLIHRTDLAVAYALIVETPALTGHFNAAAQEGARVGDVATWISSTFGAGSTKVIPKDRLAEQFGIWAEGPTLDQQLRAATGWTPEILDYRSPHLFAL